jgi:hypothetical protein
MAPAPTPQPAPQPPMEVIGRRLIGETGTPTTSPLDGPANDYPCQLWWASAEATKMGTNLSGKPVCYNGVKYACVQKIGIPTIYANSRARDIIALCPKAREATHFAETAACRTDRSNQPYVPDNIGPVSEARAYFTEFKCLNDNLYRCRNERDCILDVLGWRKQADAYLDPVPK